MQGRAVRECEVGLKPRIPSDGTTEILPTLRRPHRRRLRPPSRSNRPPLPNPAAPMGDLAGSRDVFGLVHALAGGGRERRPYSHRPRQKGPRQEAGQTAGRPTKSRCVDRAIRMRVRSGSDWVGRAAVDSTQFRSALHTCVGSTPSAWAGL